MKQSFSTHHLLPELQEAIINGFPESFVMTATGLLWCLADPNRFYELSEVEISPPITLSIPATLFRIVTNDGLWRGTFIDFEY